MRHQHVVTTPREPFLTKDGRLEVHQIPAWKDNLVWLAVCVETREAAAVDGPDAEAALEACKRLGVRLTTLLNTHTHWDHIGINKDLARRGLLADLTVYGPAGRPADVPGITHPVGEGDTARVGNVDGQVLLTEGHMDGHISYVFDDVLFCGDTLFAAGCGYLFDGPPAKMHRSLTRLAALPDATRVCCAHEYTEDNLRFAWSVEPDNPALAARIRRVWALRAKGECAVPSTIGEERATNPFMRWESATIQRHVAAAFPDQPLTDGAAIFAATRALKDRKTYRQAPDTVLPLATS